MTDDDQVAGCLADLHRYGWNIGDAAFLSDFCGMVWVFSGSNGENLIRAERPTSAAAWRAACDQARSLRMLGAGGHTRPEEGGETCTGG
jgi:hypothetical protein